MINSFNAKVQEELQYYVYALIDPRDHSLFYIGKGTGNRVFDHEKLKGTGSQEKQDLIQAIHAADKSVQKVILGYGLNEEEAYKAESVAINLFRYCTQHQVHWGQVANAIDGHRTAAEKKYGKVMSGAVDEIAQRLDPELVNLNDLAANGILVISIDPAKRDTANFLGGERALIKDDHELLDHFNSPQIALRSLGKWSMSKANGEKYHYIIAISHTDHLIVGAFKLLRSPQVIPAPTPKQPQRIRLAWADPDVPNPAEVARSKYYEPIHELASQNGQMIELGTETVNGQPVRNIKKLVCLDKDGHDQLLLSQFGRLQHNLES